MINFMKQLEESGFFDLLVSIGQMRYGDSSRLYEYLDEEDRRVVHLWDNGGSFKDNGQDYIWVNDYETSNPNFNFNHNLCMLSKFGEEWYTSAQKYFEDKKPEGLAILSEAKAQFDRDLEADKEFINSLEDEDILSK